MSLNRKSFFFFFFFVCFFGVFLAFSETVRNKYSNKITECFILFGNVCRLYI